VVLVGPAFSQVREQGRHSETSFQDQTVPESQRTSKGATGDIRLTEGKFN
jgi:hypothetical protein